VLHPLTQEVLLVLELSSRVSEVLDRCSFPDYQVLPHAPDADPARGMVELRTDSTAPDPPAGGCSRGARSAAARLLDQGRRATRRRSTEGGAVRVEPEAASAFTSAARAAAGRRSTRRGRERSVVTPVLRIPSTASRDRV